MLYSGSWPQVTALSGHTFYLKPPYHSRVTTPVAHLNAETNFSPYTSPDEIRTLVFPASFPYLPESTPSVVSPFYGTLVKWGCAPHVIREQWERHKPYVLPSFVFGLTLLGLAFLKGSSPTQNLFYDRVAQFSTASLLLCFWVFFPKESLEQAQTLAEDISRLDACTDPELINSTLRNLKYISYQGLQETEIVLGASLRFLTRTQERGPDYVRLRLEVLKASFYVLSNIPWGATGDLSDTFYQYVEQLDKKACLDPCEIYFLIREVSTCGETSNPALRLLTARIYALLKKEKVTDPVVREPPSRYIEVPPHIPGSKNELLNDKSLDVLNNLFTAQQVKDTKKGMEIARNLLNVVPLIPQDDSIRGQMLALVVNAIARKSGEILQEDLEEIIEPIGNYFRYARDVIAREDRVYMIRLMQPYILHPNPAIRLAFAMLYYKMHHDTSDIQIGQFEDG